MRRRGVMTRTIAGTKRAALHWPRTGSNRQMGERLDHRTATAPETRAEAEDVCVVLNAASGSATQDRTLDEIRRAFAAEGLTARVDLLREGADAPDVARAAQERGHRVVVAAGGDGTLAAVAGALAGTGACMGILPLGTFNYFARSLGLPQDLAQAVRVIARGAVRPTRLARINDRVFLNNASLGAYPAILREREEVYRRWGRSRAAAYWSVLRTLVQLRRPLRVTITADGATRAFRTQLVFVVNNAFQLNELGLQGADEIAVGRMAVFVAPDEGRWGMIRNALAIAAGRAQKHRNFEIMSGRDVTIATGRKARSIACDGERERMRPPFELQVWPDALDILVPEGQEEGTR